MDRRMTAIGCDAFRYLASCFRCAMNILERWIERCSEWVLMELLRGYMLRWMQ
jgi:hypothetical protein